MLGAGLGPINSGATLGFKIVQGISGKAQAQLVPGFETGVARHLHCYLLLAKAARQHRICAKVFHAQHLGLPGTVFRHLHMLWAYAKGAFGTHGSRHGAASAASNDGLAVGQGNA